MISKILYSSERGGKGNVSTLLDCIDAKPDRQSDNAERAEANYKLHFMTCLSGLPAMVKSCIGEISTFTAMRPARI
jgi:hypothetical protein